MTRRQRKRRAERQARQRRGAAAIDGVLRLEPLETRQLLAITANPRSVEDVAAEILPYSPGSVTQSIKHVTVVTHGFQPQLAGSGDSLMPLAEKIYTRAGADKAWLLDYDVSNEAQGNGVLGSWGDRGVGVFDADQSKMSAENPTDIVLLWDWADESNDFSAGWTGASADALFTTLVSLHLANPVKGSEGNGISFHFIAHSFGSAVTSEVVRRFDAYHMPVDQVTFLDPHDFDEKGVPIDEDQNQSVLGYPGGYGVTRWDNVGFTDVYYQTSKETLVPQGRPIPGAYNRWISNSDLPGGNVASGGDHSDVWRLWYANTVTDATATTGFAYSEIANRGKAADKQVVRPPQNNFYSDDQHHDFTPSQYVTKDKNGAWVANTLGLSTARMSAEDLKTKAWPVQFDTFAIYNGGFDFKGYSGISSLGYAVTSDFVPGWNNHGGGGLAKVTRGTGDPSLSLTSKTPSRVHNTLYVPQGAAALSFTLKRTAANTGDYLVVRLGNDVLLCYKTDGTIVDGRIQLDQTDATKGRWLLTVPFTNRTATLSFSIERSDGGSVDAAALIDDVRFLDKANADKMATPGEPGPWGVAFAGEPFTLSADAPSQSQDIAVPLATQFIDYTVQRQTRSLNDVLVVTLDGEEIDRLSLDAVDDKPFTRRLAVGADYGGTLNPVELAFRIERPGTFNFFTEGAVQIKDVRFTSAAGLTGDIIPIDFATLTHATAGSTFAIDKVTGIAIQDPTAPGGERVLSVREAYGLVDGALTKLRSDWELTYKDADGKERLAGYLLFSDRIERGKQAFSQTGRAWFAPATGAYRRLTDLAPNTMRDAYFERLPSGSIAGDRDPLAAGFQGRLRFEVSVTSTGVTNSRKPQTWVEVGEGQTGVGDYSVSAEAGAADPHREHILAIAQLQQ